MPAASMRNTVVILAIIALGAVVIGIRLHLIDARGDGAGEHGAVTEPSTAQTTMEGLIW